MVDRFNEACRALCGGLAIALLALVVRDSTRDTATRVLSSGQGLAMAAVCVAIVSACASWPRWREQMIVGYRRFAKRSWRLQLTRRTVIAYKRCGALSFARIGRLHVQWSIARKPVRVAGDVASIDA